MTLRTLIIDDEPLAHEVILTFAKEIEFIDIVGQCYRATQALTLLNEQPVDLLFLDIQMPVLTGIELLKVLPNKPQVIITSAYEEYALQGFELDVTDYLLKPFRFERFAQATNKALTRHNALNLPANKHQGIEPAIQAKQQITPPSTHILIKVDKKQIRVALNEISCAEAYGNYVKVWRGDSCLLTPSSLTKFEQSLPTADFIRIHKSVIVNKSYIDFIENNNLHLKSGKHFAIGQQYKKQLKEALG